jgi:hypothetical protein
VLARPDQLVSGREDGDARPAPHGDASVPHRRREREPAGIEPHASAQQNGTFREIEARRPDMAARPRRLAQDHAHAVNLDMLLDHNAVGAVGKRRAREDADGFAGTDDTFEAAARGARAD